MDKNRPSAQSEGQLLDFWQQEGPTSFLKVLQEKGKKKESSILRIEEQNDIDFFTSLETIHNGKMFTFKKKRSFRFLWWLSGKESICQCRRHVFGPWSGKIPTCRRATKPVSHSYWAYALEPMCSNYWSLHAPEPMLCNKRSHARRSWRNTTRD